MVPPTPPPSARLRNAAVAERADLSRHRSKLLESRESLRSELERLDMALRELDERSALLARLAGDTEGQAAATEDRAAGPSEDPGRPDVEDGLVVLRGPDIRRVAVRVILELPDRPEALHYRDWLDRLRAAGYTVAGKDPQAVFLSQLTRSPAVRKSSQPGVYEVDRHAAARLRNELARRHDELARLPAAPSTAEIATVRERRAALNSEINRAERALLEAEEVLKPALGALPVATAAG